MSTAKSNNDQLQAKHFSESCSHRQIQKLMCLTAKKNPWKPLF